MLLNPKGFLEVGKDSKPSAIMKAGIKVFGTGLQSIILKTIKRHVEKTKQSAYSDPLKSLKTLADNLENNDSKIS